MFDPMPQPKPKLRDNGLPLAIREYRREVLRQRIKQVLLYVFSVVSLALLFVLINSYIGVICHV